MKARRLLCAAVGAVMLALPALGKGGSVADFGARCDGVTDDSVALQAALDAGGTVTFPDGATCIARNLTVRSNTSIWLGTATLDVGTNTGFRTWMFQTEPGSVNVSIRGGTMRGSRTTRVGQWAIGVRIDSACPPEVSGPCEVLLDGVTLLDWPTDGFHVGGNSKSMRVTIRRTTVAFAGRNGGPIVNADRVSIEDSIFSDTTPLAGDPNPASGLVVEPNPGESVDNLTVRGCVFARNRGPGIYDHDARGLAGRNHRIIGNSFLDNGPGLPGRFGLVINGVMGALISDNYIRGSQGGDDRRLYGRTSGDQRDLHGQPHRARHDRAAFRRRARSDRHGQPAPGERRRPDGRPRRGGRLHAAQERDPMNARVDDRTSHEKSGPSTTEELFHVATRRPERSARGREVS